MGLDDGSVAAPLEMAEDDGEPTGASSLRAAGPSGSGEPLGPSLHLPHVHAVEPVPNLTAAREALAQLDPADPLWVEWQHRIAVTVMGQAEGSSLDELRAAAEAPSAAGYAHMDDLRLDYGAAALEAGHASEGQQQLLALIRHHPMSPAIPHAYAAFADHVFEDGDGAHAAQLYEKLTAFGDPAVDAYAAYRIGWCHLRAPSGDEARALEQLVEAVHLAHDLEGAWARRLESAALSDAALAYAEVGEPAEARSFFAFITHGSDTGPDDALRRLAWAYLEAGDDDAVAQVCREVADPCPSVDP